MFNISTIWYSEYTGSTTLLRGEIMCDTASDLPAPTAITGITLIMGCKALDISTGNWYRMQDGGTWVLQPVSAADTYTTTQIDTMINGRIPYSMPGTIPATDDLNDYTTPGTYYMEAGTTNAPTTSGGRIDIVEITNAQIVQQRYYGSGSTTRIYVRNLQTVSPVAWHPWIPVDTLGIGIGISLTTGNDLNDIRKYGVYVAASTAVAASILHRPAYSSSGSKMFIVRADANRFRIQQTLTTVNISSGTDYGNLEFFSRIGESDGSRWGSWHQMTTTIVADYP